ncbi:MAG: XisH family protein [Chloroflexaceae bacterium]|nr:XisH family protein [Chloroflexaceae bacterium]
MPARDIYHEPIKAALLNAGWIITHDPFRIEYRGDQGFIDLGAERLVAAQYGQRKIAVEVKSFLNPSLLTDVQQAIGQYLFYRTILDEIEPDRILVLGISSDTATELLGRPAAVLYLERQQVQVMVVAIETEEIVRWTLSP